MQGKAARLRQERKQCQCGLSAGRGHARQVVMRASRPRSWQLAPPVGRHLYHREVVHVQGLLLALAAPQAAAGDVHLIAQQHRPVLAASRGAAGGGGGRVSARLHSTRVAARPCKTFYTRQCSWLQRCVGSAPRHDARLPT